MTTDATPVPAAGRGGWGGTPDHGTESRYRGSRNGSWTPCRCEPCIAAYTRVCKQRDLAHLQGIKLIYPASTVVDHITMLNNTGMNAETIARRAGVAHSTISYLLRGRSKTCQRRTAIAILSVRPGDYDEHADRPATGIRRRLQALYAIGHSPETIADEAGMCAQAISQIANGHTTWADEPTESAIHATYNTLRNQKGTSPAAARRAANKGWRDPVWWEDYERIDDPDFDPAAVERELSRNELGALRRREVQHLMSAGCDAAQIAARIGLGVSTVQAIMAELTTGTRRDRAGAAA